MVTMMSLARIAELVSRIETLERQMAALVNVPSPTPQIPISDVKNAIRRYYGVAAAELEGRSRSFPVMRARQIAMYLARRLTAKSLTAIGRCFGDRDHTIVFKACTKIERLRLTDAALDSDIRTLAKALRPGGVGG